MERSQYAYKGASWKEWPKADAFIDQCIVEFLDNNIFARQFAESLLQEANCSIRDITDYIVIYGSPDLLGDFMQYGFEFEQLDRSEKPDDMFVLWHPNADFPRMVFADAHFYHKQKIDIAISVDSLEFFQQKIFLDYPAENEIHGTPGGPFSRMRVGPHHEEYNFFAVERHAYRGMIPVQATKQQREQIKQKSYYKKLWKYLKKTSPPEEDIASIQNAVIGYADYFGRDLAADIIMEAEREYWESHNTAARLQKARQDECGIGWANHDHHTFRSSRKYFHDTIALFESLGFHCRERFYAGKEAGWGAQVMENPVAGITIFCDVDLGPDEVAIDFAHEKLSERNECGTIGLWCALHGESISRAGMHHLEIQCQFVDFRNGMRKYGIDVLKPFNGTENGTGMLNQAFTEGERWTAPKEKIYSLLHNGYITKEQADMFITRGAIGSHLEHLQRKHGFKGFLSKGVSNTIRDTDPRNH